jgi:hypothetical protein
MSTESVCKHYSECLKGQKKEYYYIYATTNVTKPLPKDNVYFLDLMKYQP